MNVFGLVTSDVKLADDNGSTRSEILLCDRSIGQLPQPCARRLATRLQAHVLMGRLPAWRKATGPRTRPKLSHSSTADDGGAFPSEDDYEGVPISDVRATILRHGGMMRQDYWLWRDIENDLGGRIAWLRICLATLAFPAWTTRSLVSERHRNWSWTDRESGVGRTARPAPYDATGLLVVARHTN